MDLARFASMIRSLSAIGTRRGLLRSLAVGALGVAIAEDASAGKRSRRKRKKQKNQRRQNGPGGETPEPGAASCTVCDDTDDCPFTSIQAAIDAATAGSTITICEGKYKENITISKNLTLIGENNDVELDGAGGNSVVTVPRGVTATIQGLTIADGTGQEVAGEIAGGGIFNGGDLTLVDVIVQDNTAGIGAGIANLNLANLTLDNTIVQENDAKDDEAFRGVSQGGGIYNEFVLILRNGSVITENEASQGGAIYNARPGEGGNALTISGGSRIEDNTADTDGAGIYSDGGEVTIDGSSVVGNKAKGNGGGIFSRDSGPLTIRNDSVIESNEAQNGGGVYNQAATFTSIDSSIAENEADDLGGGIFNIGAGATVALQASTVFENDAGDLGGGIFNTEGGVVTLDADSGVVDNKPNNCTGTAACDV
jgi:hypothetical protein